MSTVSLLNNHTFNNTAVTENGQYNLYSSNAINNPTDANSLRVVVEYKNNLPDPESTVVKYNLVTIVESSDSQGNWYPLHYQYQPFVKEEAGGKHILVLEPSMFTFDEGVPSSIYDGVKNIAIESKKQGRLSDDFRICVFLNENGYGEPGAFQSVDVSLHYEIYNVQK